MGLWQLPMYQKSTVFLDLQLKRFSGNKPNKLTQNGPKRCIFRNFQTHYLGSTMCLWYLPMYQKSTEFFSDPGLKQFSGNKPHKLNQNGPKGVFFEIFKPIIWRNYVPVAIAHVPKVY